MLIAGAEVKMKGSEFYDVWEERTATAPKREHLATSPSGPAGCSHSWRPVPPSEELTARLVALFEENILGSSPAYCAKCGAAALFDQMMDRFQQDAVPTLWAYDATARIGTKREEPARAARPQQRRR